MILTLATQIQSTNYILRHKETHQLKLQTPNPKLAKLDESNVVEKWS